MHRLSTEDPPTTLTSLLTLALDLDFQSPIPRRTMVMTNIYTQKFKVRGQVVQKLEWGPVDRWSETTDVLKPLVNDVGNYTVLQKKYTTQPSAISLTLGSDFSKLWHSYY